MKYAWIFRWISAGLVATALAASAQGQQTNDTGGHGRGEFDDRKVLRMPSEILSKGSNESPVGKMKVKTYRLERIKLDDPAQLGDQKFDYVYKIVVTGGPFSGPFLLWVNDHAVPLYPEVSDRELVTLFFGKPSFLKDGATLSISPGGNPCSFVEGSEVVLPEKLSVPAELRADAHSSKIRLRSVRSAPQFNGEPAVDVIVTMDVLVPIQNQMMAVQVGKESFWGGRMGSYEVGARVPYEAFARIPENSQVIVKWGGRCAPIGSVVGRLDKSTLDH